MITKQDCLALLFNLKEQGIDCNRQITQTLKSVDIPLDIIKYINDIRPLDLTQFYTKIRKSYNNKRSNLYINIVKEIDEPNDVLTTLSAMLTQILIFAKHCEDKQMFLRQSRAQEITVVLNNYFKTYDITNAIKLLHIIKTDIKTIEYFQGRDVEISPSKE